MMHDAVTKSPSPASFYPHKQDDLLVNGQTKSNMSARDILATSGAAARRPQSVGLQKPERSGRLSVTNANVNGGGRWRINSFGQLVDSVSAEWDIADDMGKLQLADDGSERKSQMRTPPQMRGGIAAGLESSPLETSSEASLGSDSPGAFDQPSGLGLHSRGSSADTTASSHTSGFSSSGQTLQAAPYTPLKVVGESRNRPHSYSGGLSTAELIRLQQAGGSPGVPETWTSPNGTPERPSQPDQPSYPSLVGQNGMPRSQEGFNGSRADEPQGTFDPSQRQFGPTASGPVMQAGTMPSAPYTNTPNRSSNMPPNQQFRQRTFSPQVPPIIQSPPNFAYPAALPMPVSSGQQIYDMMLPTPPLENPAMARVQQQAPYRSGHQHSASDPASLRDPAMLALLNNNVQAAFAAGQLYGPAMVPPSIALFNQYYGTPDAYGSPELAMMARLQPQYTGQFGLPLSQNLPVGGGLNREGGNHSHSSSLTAPGPNANNRKLGLYKTELCRSWEEKGTCRYGAKCQFAHGEEELRQVQRHPKYKTEICRTFWVSGSCPYGKRCCFIHTELPGQANQENSPSMNAHEGRPRSESDPNDGATTSLLARIKRQDTMTNAKPGTPPSAGFGGRPGSLRVDTSVLDSAANKQNKSAFPTFTHNGILMPANDDGRTMSPGPVTAAPDFGRHAAARLDIVGSQRARKTNDSNVRHSFNGSDIQLDLSATTPTASNQAQFSMTPTDMQPPRAARISGHVRSGSAGNWGAATRTSHLTAYPLSSIPGGELKTNAPWADYSARRAENNWA